VRICDPFREAGMWFLVSEHHFELVCTCGALQRVDALVTRVQGGVTLYECPLCGATLVGIAADDRAAVAGASPTAPPDDGDGHRMCGFVFASAVDMALFPSGATEPFVELPARPRFFSARGLT
jgi:hypothetical protein